MKVVHTSNNGHQKRSNEEIVKDFDFYTDNYDYLVEKYLNQWIAIYGEQVVASAPDYFEMESQLEAKGIPWNQAIREYMSESREFLIATSWGEDELRDILNVQRVLRR